MITLYRRGRVFWARHCQFGKEMRRSLRTRDPQVARALVRQLETEILSGGQLRRIHWPEFESEFLSWIEPQIRPHTLKGYRFSAQRFGRFLAAHRSTELSALTPAVISAYIEERRLDRHPSWKRGLSPGGVRFELRILHRIFGYAVDCGYLPSNPVRARNLNSDAGKTLPFTQEEIAAMLADKVLRADPRLAAIVLTLLHTGLRIGDVIHLQKSQIGPHTIVRRTQKRGRVVSLRIHPLLRDALDRHFAAQSQTERKSPLAFPSDNGRPLVGLDKLLRRLWKRCGVAGGHAHRFRDTFAVRLLSKGASLYDVSKLMGISMQTAERHYTPYVKELQERGAALLAQLDFAPCA